MCIFNARPTFANNTNALSSLASQMGTTATQMYAAIGDQSAPVLTSGFTLPGGQYTNFGSSFGNYGGYGQQGGYGGNGGQQQLNNGMNQLFQSMMSLLTMMMQSMMSFRGSSSSNSSFGALASMNSMNTMNAMNAMLQSTALNGGMMATPAVQTTIANPTTQPFVGMPNPFASGGMIGQGGGVVINGPVIINNFGGQIGFGNGGIHHPGTCGGFPPVAQPWTVEQNGQKGTINLGDKYKLELNEADMSWKLTNKETGKATRIWGDPHVDELGDGSNDWDFKKDATFMLEDGTKITVNNAGDEKSMTLSSKLTITNARTNQAVVVSGLAGGTDGANNLKIEKRDGQGRALDAATADGGLVLAESKDGRWRFADNGADVNQAEVNKREAKAGSNLWTTNKELFK